ncbi:AraC family transcriptional regulator [Brevundimonas sp.]|uniref:helix-turn-helix transcriptional regulator n=1 Tax=Brevundimonas sp. TaxID=1871086 RepID=UPI002D38F983|nr:AraC family transcriptional regulator [Brevundimonas sp.]HYC68413.1 AraC family transcriptional regulator [Brevundimonas sp.]
MSIWEGGSLWVVDALPNTRPAPRSTGWHAHHAIQVTLGLGGWFQLDTASRSLRGPAVAVAADASHSFQAEGLVAILFIEPESRAGRAVARNLFGRDELAALPDDLSADFRARAAAAWEDPGQQGDPFEDLGRALIHRLAGDGPADHPDPRVDRMLAFAADHIEGPISLADVVADSGLSASRLSHLFVQHTGLPFRTYLLWLRLTRAVETIAAGGGLTEAAHEAGFADSAHFSRTFRRMFGVAPAQLRMA